MYSDFQTHLMGDLPLNIFYALIIKSCTHLNAAVFQAGLLFVSHAFIQFYYNF